MSEHQWKKKREDRVQIKPDDGIATLSTGLRIREELRDQLEAHDWTKPRNPGTIQTTDDLVRMEFSGFRVNVFTGDVELWCIGRVAARERCIDVTKNPGLLATMHERAFATVGTIVALGEGKKPLG